MNSPDDRGTGSLRWAIGQAGSGDTIAFAPKLHGQTIALTGGVIDINQNITIDGPGRRAGRQGSGLSGVFGVSLSASVTISGLTITGGSASQGGGIFNAGTLTLVTPRDGQPGPRRPRALYAAAASTTTGRSRWRARPSPTTGWSPARRAGRTALTPMAAASRRGRHGHDHRQRHQRQFGRRRPKVAPFGSPYAGGFAYGGGIELVQGKITITGTTISGNQAIGGAAGQERAGLRWRGGRAEGGGIDNPGNVPGNTITLIDSSVIDNQAIGGPAAPRDRLARACTAARAARPSAGASTKGRGPHALRHGRQRRPGLRRGRAASARAAASSGSRPRGLAAILYSIRAGALSFSWDCDPRDRRDDRRRGPGRLGPGAREQRGDPGPGGAAQGGGIFVAEGSLTMTDTPVSSDAARGGAGGPASPGAPAAPAAHRAVASTATAPLGLTDATVSGDAARGGGGGAGLSGGAGGAASGSGLADGVAVVNTSVNLFQGQYNASVVPATVTITGAIMLGDQAAGGAGGAARRGRRRAGGQGAAARSPTAPAGR